jgi:hypothetical protein
MKKMLMMLFTTFLMTGYAFAQDDAKVEEDAKMVSHTVMMGETISLISKKYLVSPQDIYKYNKEAVDGISYNMVLQIPMHKSFKAQKAQKAAEAQKEALANAPEHDGRAGAYVANKKPSKKN